MSKICSRDLFRATKLRRILAECDPRIDEISEEVVDVVEGSLMECRGA